MALDIDRFCWDHVQIAHRCFHAIMPEKKLARRHIILILNQMSGKGLTKYYSATFKKYKNDCSFLSVMSLDGLVTQPEVHPKGWGRELWIANLPLYCGKILELNKGKRCSIHYHKIKDETFYILSSKVQMNLYHNSYPGDPTSIVMQPGDTIHIPQKLSHQFIGLEDSQILEISTQHFEEDSYRLLKGD